MLSMSTVSEPSSHVTVTGDLSKVYTVACLLIDGINMTFTKGSFI